jgi:hypothetical protein
VVKKCVPVEKVIKQTYYETVPYETTIKVPVYTPVAPPVVAPVPAPMPVPCASPCPEPCATPIASTRGGRGGIFRGRMSGNCCP